MTVGLVAMVKDEADIAYSWVMHHADEAVDVMLIHDNGSTDGTRDELERAARDCGPECRVIIEDDPEVGYRQSAKMTAWAERLATEFGCDWILPVDCDELWVAPDRLGVWLRRLSPQVGVVHANLYHHLRTIIDEEDPLPFRSMVWRQPRPADLPKVAFRWASGASVQPGNHGVSGAIGGVSGGLTIRHFPYRSFEHMLRKVINGGRAYEATDLPYETGAHWRSMYEIYKRHGEEEIHAVWNEHYLYRAPVQQGLVRDPAPYLRWRTT